MSTCTRLFAKHVVVLLIGLGACQFGLSKLAFAAEPPQYKVVASPGRDADLHAFERLLNELANQGWEFDNWLYRGSAQAPDLIFHRKKDFVPGPAAAALAGGLERVVLFRTGVVIPLGNVEGLVSVDSVTVKVWPTQDALTKAKPNDTTKVTVRFTYTNRDIKKWKCVYSVAFLDEKGAEIAFGEEREADLDKRREADTNDITVKMRTLDFPRVAKLSIRALPFSN